MDKEYYPLVSIIIPVYNGANYMREAINSAINQTYPNKEIIVINDGSKDNGETKRIALEYGSRIQYYEKINGGCASALNFGIKKMHGEWFSWLSHDDKYYPKKIEDSIGAVRKNGIEDGTFIVYCNSVLIDEKGDKIFHPVPFRKEGFYSPNAFFHSLLNEPSLNGCALLIHKDVLAKVGLFDESLTYTLDFDYWLRIAMNGIGMLTINKVLCSNRVHAQQVSVILKDRKNTDLQKQLKKDVDIISRMHLGDNFFADLWMYAYTKGFNEVSDYIVDVAKMSGCDLRDYKNKGRFKRVKVRLKELIKSIYKLVFKKGMD